MSGHLLDAAPLFTTILHGAPGVALLVTSRERLQLHGEQLFPLGGLGVPAEPALAEHSEATRLFLQVARRVSPYWAPVDADHQAITAICRLTGGMPLAIELAGAWAAVLAPAAILAELRRGLNILATEMRDAPERQRSVQAVFDATWRQMRPDLRAVFAQLAVFRGGFSYQAAAGVASATLRDLADLAGAALLSYDPDRERYMLHALLRQYAAERLAQDLPAEATVLDMHAAFFCTYAAQLASELRGSQQRAARRVLEAEQENISAAWRRAVQHRRTALLDLATPALGLFYILRADIVRGAAAFGDEVAALGEDRSIDATLRARLLTWRSVFLHSLGQIHEAEELASRALELLGETQEASDTWHVAEANAHLNLAWRWTLCGMRGRGRSMSWRCVVIARLAGPGRRATSCIISRGCVATWISSTRRCAMAALAWHYASPAATRAVSPIRSSC